MLPRQAALLRQSSDRGAMLCWRASCLASVASRNTKAAAPVWMASASWCGVPRYPAGRHQAQMFGMLQAVIDGDHCRPVQRADARRPR
ncbi:hypothetical protein EYC55_20055 [Xanthomonas oryzae]|nr:hypothetical protein EYC55_20055 [Xanthomonas oryzae]